MRRQCSASLRSSCRFLSPSFPCVTSVRTYQESPHNNSYSKYWHFMKRKRMEEHPQEPPNNSQSTEKAPPRHRYQQQRGQYKHPRRERSDAPRQQQPQRKAPNYFLAVRIRNEAAVARIIEMQNYIAQNHSHVER